MGSFQKEAGVRYQRSCNHTYLVLQKKGDTDDDYQLGMILENRIPGLLPVECRECEGEKELYYEISSLQPISRIYEHKELGWEEVKMITKGILDAYDKLQDYLLDDAHVVLEPEQIYLGLDDRKISLVFFPYYEGTREESFLRLAEYFLDRIDHRDTTAAMFAYQFYKIVRRDNFVPEDIRRALEDPGEGESEKEKVLKEKIVKERMLPEPDQDVDTTYRAEYEGNETPGNNELQTDLQESGKMSVLPLLAVLLVIGGVLIASGVIPGIRSGSTRPLTAGLLILIGVALFLLSIWKKKPPKAPSVENIFSDMEPVSAEDIFSGEQNRRFSVRTSRNDKIPDIFGWREENDEPKGADRESKRESGWLDAYTEDEENYGKTVFMEPEREELRCILKEKGKSKEYFMKSFPFTIGKVRDCVDLALSDSSVSRIHARIMKMGDGLCLQDCRSTNGTFLNGMRLEAEEKVMIGKGDELGIGKLKFELI